MQLSSHSPRPSSSAPDHCHRLDGAPCASSHLVANLDRSGHGGPCSDAERLQERGRGSRPFRAVFTGRIWPAARGRSSLFDRNYGGHPAHASARRATDGQVHVGVRERVRRAPASAQNSMVYERPLRRSINWLRSPCLLRVNALDAFELGFLFRAVLCVVFLFISQLPRHRCRQRSQRRLRLPLLSRAAL